MLSVVNSSLQNVGYVPLYTFLKLLFGVERLGFIKRLSLYEFTLWGRDLVPVVRIREGPYYRGFSFKENI